MSERERSGVPPFADEHEAAAFWDEHSPLDFPDAFEPAEITIGHRARTHDLTVTLDQATIDALDAVARAQGIGPSSLARMWIMEHLQGLSSSTTDHR